MSRYIDADALIKEIKLDIVDDGLTERMVFYRINDAPSIDVVHCFECKWEWTQKCPPHRVGLIHDESDYCSYGTRKEANDE